MHTNIFIFGDSVSFGCYDRGGGWVQRLSNFAMERYLSENNDEFYTYNLSTHSQTTSDILIRLESEITPRLFREWPSNNIVVFAIGLNDSAYVHSKKGNWVGFNEFEVNIGKLVDSAGKFSKKIIFVGLYPINEAVMNPMPYDLDKSYRNEDVKRYDQKLMAAAKENNVEYIPIFDKFEAQDYKKLLHDGAHPNSAGHKLIFEAVRDYLLEKKII
jgi:lysophospholipase L1-like esterase